MRAAQKSGETSAAANFEQLVELGKTNKQLDANDQAWCRSSTGCGMYAFDQRASDIHLEPRRDMGAIRFRIDGVLHTVYQVPMAVMSAMTARIKLLGRMDVVEKRRPQDGRIKTKRPDGVEGAGDEVEMRLSTLAHRVRREDGDAHLRSRHRRQDASRRSAFRRTTAQRWDELISTAARHHPRHRPHRQRQDHDAVLHAEAAGHRRGQRLHDRRPDRDDRAGVQPDPGAAARIDLGFAEGLRALMRQDPDIIMVGEIRDLETAEMAIQAALTGHLVFSTLHTNDAASAITRLADLGVPPYLISATVIGVLAQRLARTLCAACKQPDEATSRDDARRDRQAVAPDRRRAHVQAGGLPRMPPHRLPRPRRPVRAAAADAAGARSTCTRRYDIAALRHQAVKDGMRPLRLAGAMKVAEGVTTHRRSAARTPAWSEK